MRVAFFFISYMDRFDCVELGYFAKAHGLEGTLRATFDVYDIQEYAESKLLYVAKDDKPIRPVPVQEFLVQTGKSALVRLVGVNKRDEAESYVGMTIFFPKDLLPKLPQEHFYFHEVIGFEVEDEVRGVIGKLTEILDLPNNELLSVDHQGTEILVPMQNEVFLGVDKEAKKLKVKLPAGLFELYVE